MIFLGLDVGSSGCKCVAFSEEGKFIYKCYKEYPTRAGQSDMNPNELFSSVLEVIKGCASNIKASEVGAISITSFGESFVPVDKNGNALSDIIMYTDKRGLAETDRLINALGKDRIMNITCDKPDAMYSLPKVIWSMENIPAVRNNVWKFLLIGDYIAYKLSGETKINYSLACRSLTFDVENRCISKEILGAAGISPDLFSQPVPCGSIVGDMLPRVADELGLPKSTKVVISAHDQVSSAIGAGVLNEGEAVDGTGTVECITPVFKGIVKNPEFTNNNFVCVPHPAGEDLYATYAFNFAGGVSLKWFRDCFASNLKPEAAQRGVSVYRILDENCATEPSSVIVVPHFMGAGGTPDLVANAKGTITGLDMAKGLPDIYRGFMEGLTFEMAYNLETLEKFGIKVDTLKATGGGATSPIWLRIKSDILKRPITPLVTDEAGAAGCAMLAAVTLGKYNNLAEAAEKFVVYGETVYPDNKFADIYAEKYDKYKKVRSALLYL